MNQKREDKAKESSASASASAQSKENSNESTSGSSSDENSSKPKNKEAVLTPLDSTFEPGPVDVICARGKEARDHEGNISFRKIVNNELQRYSKARSKVDKSLIVMSIYKRVQEGSPNGGFVKSENGIWHRVSEGVAREKIGQSLRDLLHLKYQSSSKAKRRRRIEEHQNFEIGEEAQARCDEITYQVKEDCKTCTTEDEIQDLFNKANAEMLRVLKLKKQRIQ